MLTHVLGNSIRRQVPKIQEVIDSSTARLEAELSHLVRRCSLKPVLKEPEPGFSA
jgi:hypothetical protein